MIEFNVYVRSPLAPRIFVNDLDGIYRLDGGIMQITFVQPAHDWHRYRKMLHRPQQGSKTDIARGRLIARMGCNAGRTTVSTTTLLPIASAVGSGAELAYRRGDKQHVQG
ncbi:MAG TPA: hypothetical protein VKT99_21090 [Xanthobacteraceae bacterium]|jgi:hypothetical protein|nr:hypothetical protein [Xanthobacteraceae bacterium]